MIKIPLSQGPPSRRSKRPKGAGRKVPCTTSGSAGKSCIRRCNGKIFFACTAPCNFCPTLPRSVGQIRRSAAHPCRGGSLDPPEIEIRNGPMWAGGELPHRGKRSHPGVSAPTAAPEWPSGGSSASPWPGRLRKITTKRGMFFDSNGQLSALPVGEHRPDLDGGLQRRQCQN